MRIKVNIPLIITLLLFSHFSSISQPVKSANGIREQEIFYYTFEQGEYHENPEDTDDNEHINAYEYMEFDSTGVWQIGQPQKANWDSAYSGSYVLMTDTLTMLNQHTRASFIFKYERPVYSNCLATWEIYMEHLYDLPINTAGIFIEVSYNHGQNWLQIIDDTLPCYYFEDDGLLCTPPSVTQYFYEYTLQNYFVASGAKISWEDANALFGKGWRSELDAAKINSVWLRFNYLNTDTLSHKGWMIDNLEFFITHNCEFISVNEPEKPNATLYPNPVTGQSVITFENTSRHEWQLNVYTMLGKLVLSEQTCNEYFLVNKTNFAKGSYVYRLTQNGQAMVTGKFLVE